MINIAPKGSNEETKNLLYDQVFKYVFKHEDVTKIFIAAFADYLNLNWQYKKVKCKTQHPILANRISKKDFYTDLMVTLFTKDIVILEAYRRWGKQEFLKSQAYQDRASSNQFKKGSNYADASMVAIINIVRGRVKSNFILDEYKLVSIRNNDIPFRWLNNKPFFVIAVDNIKNIDYNENIEFLRIVDFLSSSNLEELKRKARKWKDDVFMRKVVDYVEEFMSDDANEGFGSQLEFQTMKAEIRGRKAGEKLGRKEGMKTGMKAGRKSGIKDEKISIARKMLLKGMDLDETAELTGLSINVLEKLKASQ